MLEVTAARYIDQLRIRIRFNNGEEGVVDLTDALWGPMFEPLKDPAVFRRFEVSELLHTVKWENDAATTRFARTHREDQNQLQLIA